MLFPRFRARSAERDRANDEARRAKLVDLIDKLIAEVDSEREGLRKRYQANVVDASFALEAAEMSDTANARLSELEAAVIYCERRVKMLDTQLDALRKVRVEATSILSDP